MIAGGSEACINPISLTGKQRVNLLSERRFITVILRSSR